MAQLNHFSVMTVLLSFFLLAQGCVSPPVNPNFHYQLDKPAETFFLPQSLHEISGLGISPDGQFLAAIEDETGTLYFIDKNSGKIIREMPFGKTGDYEGVEFAGGDVFVVKSNGSLYQIIKPGDPEQEVVKHDSPFGKSYDVEGLAYDPAQNRLLLACKGDSGIPNARAFFPFYLDSMRYDTVPAFVITRDSIAAFLQANAALDRWEKLTELFNPEEPELAFSPSALAIHPLTGEMYILSSVGKLLIVFDPATGAVRHIQKLKKQVLPQPEGICFDQDGTLYISSEGKEGAGRILRFDYRPRQ